MSSLFGSTSGPSPGTPANPDMQARKEKFMTQVRNELALSGAQELINKINEKCFAKCITKPSTSLSSSEEARVLPIQNVNQGFAVLTNNWKLDMSFEVYG
ncbi:hypothetical protein A7U60_g8145 [Sanghuangporus baumii]|uniref:Mitochondrial import inner membrane translocase subunit n=1 Tax=Sanghuangporus baumii TaxID=108892 RepID=A0A9Q5HRZ8_SANBA|nr:hypothetical protein A7U60_g8145 [Sanghuangporus baumii]